MIMRYTKEQIAKNLSLWNAYFNIDGLMTDDEFNEMTYDERLEMLIDAFGPDEEATEEENDCDNY